ncbi:hypothetical protein [Pedobacter polysacchareus]|uniref:hypothetical protein n=1 Tax=Pedobacter polysacchareus TaxID=2861973 RepID=UPI001C995F01|nr:hypothetical protein [Pedobacter polysacchareus]
MNELSAELERLPLIRRLRGYAFDPSLSLQMDTSAINDLTYKIKWEPLVRGPIGEYVEVIDYDPSTKMFYQAVDLEHKHIIACDGLAPSESNPQFHQQMVYAVAMTTISNFEKALGRKILWANRDIDLSALIDKQYSINKKNEYVKCLRIYPHALRDANAYYSPQKKALLFGYFSASPAEETLQMPNSLVFTCLSHDIIAHEITHAILDGMQRDYNNPTNPDVLAFHEAFADLVALFQHFTFPEVLKHQIAQTKGDLKSENMLGKLAQQFGQAIGSYGSLRDAIGEIDSVTNFWKPKAANPADYRNITEPHDRGSILVATVFEAFISIYKSRTKDLLRIATNGTGILPAGELHPDIVNRLANEASKSAGHVLNMCIRAIDYCPPVDITFGDFLRAIITADLELVTEDSKDYRLAFIDAFRRRGIFPSGIKTLSVESLQHQEINLKFNKSDFSVSKMDNKNIEKNNLNELNPIVDKLGEFLRKFANELRFVGSRDKIWEITNDYMRGRFGEGEERINGLQRIINTNFPYSEEFSKLTGLVFVEDFASLGIQASKRKNYKGPEFKIQNLRLVNRIGPDNNSINQVVFSIIQTVKGYFNEGKFSANLTNEFEKSDFQEFTGGCTIIFDLDNLILKYVVSKPLIDIKKLEQGKHELLLSRLKAIHQFTANYNVTDSNGYFAENSFNEPFAFLHQH